MNATIKTSRFLSLVIVCIMLGTIQFHASSIDAILFPVKVEKITSPTLEKEREIFEKFIASFCSVSLQQPLAQKMISEAFFFDEESYLSADPATLFFHALHEDEVVGYISCDLLPGYRVRIRQLAVDPVMFDINLVKELLFAIFSSAPRVKSVIVSCPAACPLFATLFEDLGFIPLEADVPSKIQHFVDYELKIHPKCKICDVLYGDIWDGEWASQEDDVDSNWADPIGSLAHDMDGNQEVRTVSSGVEDELSDVL